MRKKPCKEHGCAPDRHGGLASKTVRNVHGMLHRALQEATERGHAPRNVASLAHPPTAKQHDLPCGTAADEELLALDEPELPRR